MLISEASKEYDISTDTLRYCEKIGLLRNIPRTPSGLRDYDENACKSIEFIKCMRGAGISIETLIAYLDLFQQGDSTIAARKELLLAEREKIKEKLAQLQAAMDWLNYKIEHYDTCLAHANQQLFKKENSANNQEKQPRKT